MTDFDEYKTITQEVSKGFYCEKRSKFLSFAHHVETEEDIKYILQNYRKEYYDARHVCYAYVLGPDGSMYRANDDGEPGSTAGKPILGQINKCGLTNILVVVVRYYGGVNLGTGGLIVAYRTAAAEAISAAETVVCQVEETVTFKYPYELTNDVMRVVKELSPNIVAQNYIDSQCEIILRIRKLYVSKLLDRLNKIKQSRGLE